MIHIRFIYYLAALNISLFSLLGSVVFYSFIRNSLHKQFIYLQINLSALALAWVLHSYLDIIGSPSKSAPYTFYVILENISLSGLLWTLPLFILRLFSIKGLEKTRKWGYPAISTIVLTAFFLEYFDLVNWEGLLPLGYFQSSYYLFMMIMLGTILLIFTRSNQKQYPSLLKLTLTAVLLIIPVQLLDVVFPAYSRFLLVSPVLLVLFNVYILRYGIKNLSLLEKKHQSRQLAHIQEEFHLTERETEIALRLIQGQTYQKIARELFISVATVKTHINRLYKKAALQNRQELVDLWSNF